MSIYEKDVQSIDNHNLADRFYHPRAKELNALEKQKQIARENNDQAAYNHAKDAIEKIIRESRAVVSPAEWDSMSLEKKISFVKVKINEAKVLHDETEFKYWSSNLVYLESKLAEETKQQKSDQLSDNSRKSQQLKDDKDYKFYFDEMMKAVREYNSSQNLTIEQKKKMFGKIFYYEGYMIDRLSSDEEIGQLMALTANELGANDMQVNLSDIIFAEIQEKYQQLHPAKPEKKMKKDDKKDINRDSNELDLSVLISQLKSELHKIQDAYHSMLSDSYIDDDELVILINMINKIIDDGYRLKTLAVNQNDAKIIATIISTLEEEKLKMKKRLNGIEEVKRTM